MSELIERLEERKQNLGGSEAIRIGVPLDLSDLDAILSALKTVRGIEELLSEGSAPEFYIADNGEYVCAMAKNHYGTTLAAAVEAAAKKGDGR